MKIALSGIVIIVFLSGCLANGFRPPPEVAVRTNFVMECLVFYEKRDNFHINKVKCKTLGSCIQDATHHTALATYKPWPVIEQLIPYQWNQGHYVPVDYMRSVAEKLGFKAQEMFDLIYGIRQKCLIKSGLENSYSVG